MKLVEAICNVERPEPRVPWDYTVDVDRLIEHFGLDSMGSYVYEELDQRLKAYPIRTWLCTDTTVGLYAIWMDGVPVGCSWQSCRKANVGYSWINAEAATLVRDMLLSMIKIEPFPLIAEGAMLSDFYFPEGV